MSELEFYVVDAIVAGPMERWTPEGWAKSQLERILKECEKEEKSTTK
jgi:hypothetical protein